MTNNYLKVGPAATPEGKFNKEQEFLFFNDRDMKQQTEIDRLTRGQERSVFNEIQGGPLAGVHVIGDKKGEF